MGQKRETDHRYALRHCGKKIQLSTAAEPRIECGCGVLQNTYVRRKRKRHLATNGPTTKGSINRNELDGKGCQVSTGVHWTGLEKRKKQGLGQEPGGKKPLTAARELEQGERWGVEVEKRCFKEFRQVATAHTAPHPSEPWGKPELGVG